MEATIATLKELYHNNNAYYQDNINEIDEKIEELHMMIEELQNHKAHIVAERDIAMDKITSSLIGKEFKIPNTNIYFKVIDVTSNKVICEQSIEGIGTGIMEFNLDKFFELNF